MTWWWGCFAMDVPPPCSPQRRPWLAQTPPPGTDVGTAGRCPTAAPCLEPVSCTHFRTCYTYVHEQRRFLHTCTHTHRAWGGQRVSRRSRQRPWQPSWHARPRLSAAMVSSQHPQTSPPCTRTCMMASLLQTKERWGQFAVYGIFGLCVVTFMGPPAAWEKPYPCRPRADFILIFLF